MCTPTPRPRVWLVLHGCGNVHFWFGVKYILLYLPATSAVPAPVATPPSLLYGGHFLPDAMKTEPELMAPITPTRS
ncbi:hypothetical protein E2C01_086538 [Portunus trituberculatus]|uniref:Uncharacterized protein n=1 Tax=Portunus trituberculatus TaxID=210409 RepID=A0A5B7JEV1_PORTR|nr:hypothetical protein [Portunus trituberculatus]